MAGWRECRDAEVSGCGDAGIIGREPGDFTARFVPANGGIFDKTQRPRRDGGSVVGDRTTNENRHGCGRGPVGRGTLLGF